MRSVRSIRLSRIFGVLGLLILTASLALAQVSGKIEGAVVDDDGKALAGVKVEATEAATGTRTVTTDKAGRYRFLGLRPGSYTTSFRLDGYFENQKPAVVRLDGTATINIKLFRAP